MENSVADDKNALRFCTGCQLCAAVCPVGAITIEMDNDGFFKPIVGNTCVDCGSCKKNCYKYSKIIKTEKHVDALSGFSRDPIIREKASSGGVTEEIFIYLLQKEYLIVGVQYDVAEERAVTTIIDSIIDLPKLRGSKYMQTFSDDTIRKMLNSSKKYAIVGTPCMIYAISSKIREEHQEGRFLFIDFFCHGTPSYYLWKAYVKKYSKDKISKIIFRSKYYGWHEFCNEFFYGKERKISKRTHEDPFFELFFSNEILNKSCYTCEARETLEYCDIRLGDFWGQQYQMDTKGVSAIVVVSERGREIIENLGEKLVTEKVLFKEMIDPQAYHVTYTYRSKVRNQILGYLGKEDVQGALAIWLCSLNIKQRLIRKIKIFIGHFPNRTVNLIKMAYKYVGGEVDESQN